MEWLLQFESNVESYSYKTGCRGKYGATWFESNVESYSYKTKRANGLCERCV